MNSYPVGIAHAIKAFDRLHNHPAADALTYADQIKLTAAVLDYSHEALFAALVAETEARG